MWLLMIYDWFLRSYEASNCSGEITTLLLESLKLFPPLLRFGNNNTSYAKALIIDRDLHNISEYICDKNY